MIKEPYGICGIMANLIARPNHLNGKADSKYPGPSFSSSGARQTAPS
jgi:hypothetical protein